MSVQTLYTSISINTAYVLNQLYVYSNKAHHFNVLQQGTSSSLLQSAMELPIQFLQKDRHYIFSIISIDMMTQRYHVHCSSNISI